MLSPPELRDIPGFEGLYAVTIDGRIWSHPKTMGPARHFGKWMAPAIDVDGYRSVQLFKNQKSLRMPVHRAVALAWVPNPDPDKLTIVNHIDGSPPNNLASNLEWCTYRWNALHAYRTKLRKPCRKLTDEQIAEARRLVASGVTATVVARQFGVSQGTMSLIVNYNGSTINRREAKKRKAAAPVREEAEAAC